MVACHARLYGWWHSLPVGWHFALHRTLSGRASICDECHLPEFLLCCLQGASAEVSMGLHLLAGGLVWLVPLGGPVHWRAELVNRLSRLPETFLPDVPSSAPEQEVSVHG